MKFVKTAESDIPTLVTIVNSAYRGDPLTGELGWTNEKGMVDGPRMNPDETEELINTETATMFKLLKDDGKENRIVGCVRVEKLQGKGEDEGQMFGYLSLLAVHPRDQARGTGSKLIARAEEWVKSEGLTSMRIMVPSVRHALIAYYQRRGYLETGTRIPYAVGAACSIEKPMMEFDFVKLIKML